MTEAIAVPRLGKKVGRVRHALHAATHRDVVLAEHDARGRERDRLQTGAAGLVQAVAGNFLGDSRFEVGDAGGVQAESGGKDIAEDDLAHVLAIDTRLRERAADRDGPELRRGHAGEGSAHRADRGTGRRYDDCVCHDYLREEGPSTAPEPKRSGASPDAPTPLYQFKPIAWTRPERRIRENHNQLLGP